MRGLAVAVHGLVAARAPEPVRARVTSSSLHTRTVRSSIWSCTSPHAGHWARTVVMTGPPPRSLVAHLPAGIGSRARALEEPGRAECDVGNNRSVAAPDHLRPPGRPRRRAREHPGRLPPGARAGGPRARVRRPADRRRRGRAGPRRRRPPGLAPQAGGAEHRGRSWPSSTCPASPTSTPSWAPTTSCRSTSTTPPPARPLRRGGGRRPAPLDRLWLCSSKTPTPGRARRARRPTCTSCTRRGAATIDVPLERHAAQLGRGGHRRASTCTTPTGRPGSSALFHRFDVLAFAWDVQEVRHLRDAARDGHRRGVLRPRRPHGRDRRRVQRVSRPTVATGSRCARAARCARRRGRRCSTP